MSDLSRTREARRALKTFLRSRALTGDPRAGETIARRWSPRPGQGTVYLMQSDIRTVLRAEREARHVARRVLAEKLELQRKLREQGDAASRAVQKYRAAQTEANVRGQRVDMLRAEWQELRQRNISLTAQRDFLQTSLQRTEQTVRDMADQLRNLPTPEIWSKTQARMRELSAELSRAYTRPGGRDAERENATRLAKKVDAQSLELRTLTAERDSLQRALSNLRESVRKGAPERIADILREGTRTAELLLKLGDRLYGKGWAE